MFGLTLVKVSGSSMEPRLRSGDFVLFRRCRSYRIGDVVLVHHPELGPIIKQIRSLSGDQLTLEGTGSFSTSSAKMGTLSTHNIRGRLWWHIPSR